MPQKRRVILIVAIIALVALVAWFAMRPRPDLTLISPGVSVYRLAGGEGALGPAGIDLSFTRASEAFGTLNVAMDLNADGAFADYGTVGGARQQEWIVRDVPVKVAPGTRSFRFDLADPDILTRNNFKMIVVLTKAPLESWTGRVPASAAVLRTDIPAILPAHP